MASTKADKRRTRSKSFERLNKIRREDFVELEQLPNVGVSLAGDLRLVGVKRPADLVGRDPYSLFIKLCRKSGAKHDPCVIDVFLSAVDFMEGGTAKPWWAFTAERKRSLCESKSR